MFRFDLSVYSIILFIWHWKQENGKNKEIHLLSIATVKILNDYIDDKDHLFIYI